jgi:hypothetical protein
MRRLATLLLLVGLLPAPAAQAQAFSWTVSNSITNPLSPSGPIGAGPNMFAGNLYLWLYCAYDNGMAAAEMDVVELRGGGAPTGFAPLNGFLNAGMATALLLAVGGCPHGPVVAGVFSVGSDAFVPDIEICLVPSAANNRSITVACSGIGYVNNVLGFAKIGSSSCFDVLLCFDLPVQDTSWGKLKSLYR